MYCNKCKSFINSWSKAPHQCPPEWEGHPVSEEGEGGEAFDHPFYCSVPATNGEDAAQKLGEESDINSGEYYLQRSEDHYEDWRVRLKGDTGPGQLFRITAASHVTYSAEEITNEYAGETETQEAGSGESAAA